MSKLGDFREEHKNIKVLLDDFFVFSERNKIDFNDISLKAKELKIFWERHEREEEKEFANLDVPVEKSLLDQHRELKGHWKVIDGAIKKKDENYMQVVLDTDFRMLYDKFITHMELEEKHMVVSK